MSNPQQLKKYLAELEEELGEKTGESKSEIQDRAKMRISTAPKSVETPEDFKSYVKFLTKGIEKRKTSFKTRKRICKK